MDQGKHFVENDQTKLITRSKARHLRRKRLNEARKTKDQFPVELTNGVNEKSTQEKKVHSDSDKTVLTKSKARRLRKKEKAKLLENCNCDISHVTPGLLQFEKSKYTNADDYKPNCYVKSQQNIFDSHLNNVQNFENLLAQSLLSLGSHNKAAGKVEELIECELKCTNQDKDKEYIYQDIDIYQLSDTSSVSEKLYTPKYVRTISAKLSDQQAKGNESRECTDTSKDTSFNNCMLQEKGLEDIATVDKQIITKVSFNWDLLGNHNNSDYILPEKDINKVDSTNVPHTAVVLKETSGKSLEAEQISQNSTAQRQSCETIGEELSTKSDKTMDVKMANTSKTREEIKAEREARKAAKTAIKGKGKCNNVLEKQINPAKADLTSASKIKSEAAKNAIPHSNYVPLIEKTLSGTAEGSNVQTKPEGKTKAELRAERRAKQEAQRAIKQEQVVEKTKLKNKTAFKQVQKNENETIIVDAIVDISTNKTVKKILKQNTHEVNLFKHLYHERELALNNIPVLNSKVHPAIVKLGIQYANKIIVGSNARCVALLVAVKQLIQDFEQPLRADFIRSLEASLQESVAYLHHCRPLAVSMQNALRHLKWQMTQLASTPTDVDAKNKLKSAIDTYILEQIQLADKAISITIQTKISNGNVILTYGYSSLIQKILMDAYDAGKQFRVIIVDGRPWLEGKEQLRRLTKYGIECSYVLINSLSFVMPEVSKVFLGAHAILANGAVMSRVGTAQVALMARAFNVPVLVACETHKSCERVQTDSIVYNELGSADDLIGSVCPSTKKSLLQNWKTMKCLNLLNITYDVTPADLVSAVVTELAILPCTSVPVILRIKPSEI